MSERRSFYRKVAYGVAIVLLLFPLSMLSTPATVDDPGGVLARLRNEYKIGQANLGDIDPASETIKLATLGLRGVAVNVLWENANHYKKTKDWTALSATLEQLAKLQPNVIAFWKFQAWNLSYNVSVEFDDYRDRYYYVIRGIKFLEKGETYNKFNPHLLWDLGWFISQKIGRSDEHVQYRRLFKADDDYHGDRFGDARDNWLLGKEWYLEAIRAVEDLGRNIGRKSPKVFYSSPAMAQINYAEAIEKEGFFDKARNAWSIAASEWFEFGERDIQHSRGYLLRLNDEERLLEQVVQLEAELDAISPGLKVQMIEEAFENLTPEEKALLVKPFGELSDEERDAYYSIRAAMNVQWNDVAQRIVEEFPEKKALAMRLADELLRAQTLRTLTHNYKADSNFDYWRTRCEFEQTADAVEARRLLFDGSNAYTSGDLIQAQQLFEQGFDRWRVVLDRFPSIVKDHTTGEDLVDYVLKYQEILDRLDMTLLDDDIVDSFPLWDILAEHDTNERFKDELGEYRRLHPEFAPQASEFPPAVDFVDEALEQNLPADDTTESDDAEADDEDESSSDQQVPPNPDTAWRQSVPTPILAAESYS